MTPVYVFEDSQLDRLYPLTYARSPLQLRCGAGTLLDRIQRRVPVAGVLVRDALAAALKHRLDVPVNPSMDSHEGVILVNARWLMTAPWEAPAPDTAGILPGAIAWLHLSPALTASIDWSRIIDPRTLEAVLPKVQRVTARATLINHPWDLLEHQVPALLQDWPAFGPRQEGTLLGTVHQLNAAQIHIAKDAVLYPGVVIDAQSGPVIIEARTEIRANVVITGPTYIGPDCVVRAGADIRAENHFGPGSRVGGEIAGSIFLGHSNKVHGGFMGQSIVGEWVNLGAGTITSNVKNTLGSVRIPINGVEHDTGRQRLGALIGDHAKLGIGTCLSTGSVVGFASHITVPRPPRFVPSFAWLTEKGIARIDFEKVQEIARLTMSQRHVAFTPADRELFVRIAADWSTHEKYTWPA